MRTILRLINEVSLTTLLLSFTSTKYAEELARPGRKGSRNAEFIEQCGALLELTARTRSVVGPLISS